jgi:hypothetical protein
MRMDEDGLWGGVAQIQAIDGDIGFNQWKTYAETGIPFRNSLDLFWAKIHSLCQSLVESAPFTNQKRGSFMKLFCILFITAFFSGPLFAVDTPRTLGTVRGTVIESLTQMTPITIVPGQFRNCEMGSASYITHCDIENGTIEVDGSEGKSTQKIDRLIYMRSAIAGSRIFVQYNFRGSWLSGAFSEPFVLRVGYYESDPFDFISFIKLTDIDLLHQIHLERAL